MNPETTSANQAAEQKLTEKIKSMQRTQKIQLLAASVLTILLAVILPTYAWLSYQKELALTAKIDSPATLEIKAGGGQAIINFELSDIDTEDDNYNSYIQNGTTYYYKDFVFCVKGESLSSYDLQLAHTTNIAFRYNIYSAVADENGDIVYIPKNNDMTKSQNYRLAKIRTDENGAVLDAENQPIYDDYAEPLDGQYANAQIVGNRVVADNTLTGRSYDTDPDTGDKLQQYADPAYWIKRGIPVYPIEKQDGGFLHAYVLRISWIMANSISDDVHENNLDIVQNNKETDMIYITAKAH